MTSLGVRAGEGGTTVVGVANPARAPWPRWLLIAVLALGVLAMHHLPELPSHRCPSVDSVNAVAMPPHPGGAVVVSPAGGRDCPDMAAMGHLCLAVLDVAQAPLAPQPGLIPMWASPVAPVPVSAAGAWSARAPPPTVSVRLSQLGVWRR